MIKIPEFLLEMSKQINTQDNRITADPLWMICYDKKEITAEGYEQFIEYAVNDNDHDIVFSTEYDSPADNKYALEYIKENYPEYCAKWEDDNEAPFEDFNFEAEWDLPKDIEKYYMTKRQKIVKACLTEADAKWFIKRKQHDYAPLYTYVFSMCFCPQMIELRNWISSLTNK